MVRPIAAGALVVSVLAMASGCDAGRCPELSGPWHVTAHCSSDFLGASYPIAQSGCDLEVEVDGEVSMDGQVWHDGTVSFYGNTGGGVMGCSGTSEGETMSLVCEPDTSACVVELARGPGSAGDAGSAGDGGDMDEPPPSPTCADISGDWTMTLCDGDQEQITVGQEGCEVWFWDVIGKWEGSIDSADLVELSIEWSLGGPTFTTACSATLDSEFKATSGGRGVYLQELAFDCSSNMCSSPPHEMVLWRLAPGG